MMINTISGLLPADISIPEIIAFGFLCSFVSLIVILINWMLLAVQNISLLDISYGTKSKFSLLLFWCLAAAFVGVLAGSLKIVTLTFPGALGVAVGWPMIFKAMVQKWQTPEPTQNTTTEE